MIPLVYLCQCAGKSVQTCTRLTVQTAARNIDKHIEFIFARRNKQRLTHYTYLFIRCKIRVNIFTVYDNFSCTITQIHAGNGSFSSSRSNSKILYHDITPLFPLAGDFVRYVDVPNQRIFLHF